MNTNNTNTYKHCVLQHMDGSTQVSWIPTKFAEEGRYLKLKENGTWKNGWKVLTAYPGILDEVVIQENERNYRNHRKATDV